MTPTRPRLPSLAAALAGVPAGVQDYGPWMGRRQLLVRFADEAETATIFTADALKGELVRLSARSKYHSIAIGGRDPLAEIDFLAVAFRDTPALPVMLEHDGQRPEALETLLGRLRMVQVRVDGRETDGAMERVCDSIARAGKREVAHAVVLVPFEGASDARLLRVVELVHAASSMAAIVLHPSIEAAAAGDRRWLVWLERAAAVHDDVRILPAPPILGRPVTQQQ